jgi:hypothetical protein
MFGKLWEWIMGIIAWIMSKFSRGCVAAPEASEVEQPVTQEAVSEGGAVAAVEPASE